MLFISLAKRRKKMTKENVAQASKLMEQMVKEGIKVVGQYWTMGRYDAVTIMGRKRLEDSHEGCVAMGRLAFYRHSRRGAKGRSNQARRVTRLAQEPFLFCCCHPTKSYDRQVYRYPPWAKLTSSRRKLT